MEWRDAGKGCFNEDLKSIHWIVHARRACSLTIEERRADGLYWLMDENAPGADRTISGPFDDLVTAKVAYILERAAR